jgi:hypothetical protein
MEGLDLLAGIPERESWVDPFKYLVDYLLAMNQIFLAAVMVIAALSAFATHSIAVAQNMSGETPEKSKLPAEQTMTGNATNTTITEGVSPNSTMTPSG